VIGDMADLLTMTRDDLYNHYRPSTFRTTRSWQWREISTRSDAGAHPELIRTHSGWTGTSASGAPEPPQNGEVRLSVEGPGETTYVQVCYRFPAASHPDFFPLAVLDSLLAGPSNLNMFSGGISNKTSRSTAPWWTRNWLSACMAARR
jgi:zinc protease